MVPFNEPTSPIHIQKTDKLKKIKMKYQLMNKKLPDINMKTKVLRLNSSEDETLGTNESYDHLSMPRSSVE